MVGVISTTQFFLQNHNHIHNHNRQTAIDRNAPNPRLCATYGSSAMVLDQRVFVTFNPFNVYVTQGMHLLLSRLLLLLLLLLLLYFHYCYNWYCYQDFYCCYYCYFYQDFYCCYYRYCFYTSTAATIATTTTTTTATTATTQLSLP